MKTISPHDASLLALLAEKPPARIRRRVLDKLDSEALNIATEIGKRGLLPNSTALGSDISASALGLEEWAKSNKKPSKKKGSRRRKTK